MLVYLLLIVVRVFEFVLPSGAATGLAGVAGLADWQQALTCNPAQASSDLRGGVSVVYTKPYGMPELDCMRAVAAIGLPRLQLNAGLQVLGMQGYHEYDLGLGLGGSVAGDLNAGVAVHGLLVEMPGSGWLYAPAVDGGILWSVSRLRLGIAVRNLNQPRLGNGDVIESQLRAGVAWEPVTPLLLAADFTKQGQRERLGAGMEIRIFPELGVRTGMETAPWCLHAGLGLRIRSRLGVDYGYSYQPETGATHFFGLSYTWN